MSFISLTRAAFASASTSTLYSGFSASIRSNTSRTSGVIFTSSGLPTSA